MGVLPFNRLRTSLFPARLAGAAIIAVLAAGCSGGGGSTAAPPVPSAPQAPQVPQGMAQVTFTMKWTGPTQSAARSPRYVPATARSVSVAVNGGTPQYLNAPASTIVIDAPIGTDTFNFASYDEQNGQGNVLSRASVTKTIVSGSANTVSATLNGVVASVTISLSNPSPNAGVPATVNVNVAAQATPTATRSSGRATTAFRSTWRSATRRTAGRSRSRPTTCRTRRRPRRSPTTAGR